MNFAEKARRVLTHEQKMAMATELLEKVEFYGLDKEKLLMSQSFHKVVNNATSQFEILRDIPASLLRISKDIDNMTPKKEEVYETTKQIEAAKNMTIMQIAIADANDLTVGEFLKKAYEKYEGAGMFDIKVSEILCADADEMLTLMMVEKPDKVSCTFQTEDFKELVECYKAIAPKYKKQDVDSAEPKNKLTFEDLMTEIAKDIDAELSRIKKDEVDSLFGSLLGLPKQIIPGSELDTLIKEIMANRKVKETIKASAAPLKADCSFKGVKVVTPEELIAILTGRA